MRIAYGVMGYGRGHAMRSSAVLPDLMKEHEVRVFAGRDAYQAMHERFPCEELPVIGYQYDASGRLSTPLTLARNARLTADLLGRGAITRGVYDRIDAFRPDIVISDSESWTHRYAQHRRLPRIGFDHVGIMAYCDCDFAPEDWLKGRRDAAGYRAFMGVPDRIIISSFYEARPRMPGVTLVGTILRDNVLAARPSNQDYLLAYFNKGGHQFSTRLETVLRASGERIIVYGVNRRGISGNLTFKAPSNDGFVQDLAHCKGLIATSGNQLLSEALHLGKPVLTLPEDVVEQRLNARAVTRMGVGLQGSLTRLDLSLLGEFAARLDEFRSPVRPGQPDGRPAALAALQQGITELTGGRPAVEVASPQAASRRG
ncbi:MAG: hypothetical protein CMN28_13305 [Salinisphaeraceae bacterium]|jgi:uncharacterized protein (TIGR00661 family)|nr:hypothetical protein [Salinisphaeraceae bacterium]